MISTVLLYLVLLAIFSSGTLIALCGIMTLYLLFRGIYK